MVKVAEMANMTKLAKMAHKGQNYLTGQNGQYSQIDQEYKRPDGQNLQK